MNSFLEEKSILSRCCQYRTFVRAENVGIIIRIGSKGVIWVKIIYKKAKIMYVKQE